MPSPAPPASSSTEPTLDIPGPSDTRTLPPTDRAGITSGPPQVPGFDIEGELGRGGMGVVYRARQTRLNRSVALKMVLAGGHAGPQERVRFLAEAEAIAAVQHPGIVQVYEFGTCADQPYFALEFCSGGSLAAKLAGTPLPPRDAAELVERIARAVQAAHEKGIVHRDLKPDNVLFAADGTPKVTDFGLARKVESDSGLTKTGAIMGTPSYMAPEQAEGKKDVGPAADVWALGAILYECLTGRPPFRAATALDTILQVASDEPVPPRSLVPNIPRDLETIALKCLQKEPAKRYHSAGAMANDMRCFLNGEPITARPVSWIERLWKKIRRRPLLTAMYFLTVFFATFAVGTLINGVRRSDIAREKAQQQAIALDKEATAARAAEAAADAQRKKAQARLEKAVEMVDRLLTRVSADNWTANPALNAERQQILEEVAAFFQKFQADKDDRDPVVRRETAKAYFRTAGIYLMLGEHAKADTALILAADLLHGLADELPGDADIRHEQAQVANFRGHAIGVSGQMANTVGQYRDAVRFAEEAVALDPSEPNRIVLAESLLSLSLVLTGDRTQAREPTEYRDRAESLAEVFGTRPGATYQGRLILARCLCGHGVAESLLLTPRAGSQERLARVTPILEQLGRETAPTPRYRNIYDLCQISYHLFRASLVARTEGAEASLAAARMASEACDRFIAVYPRYFPVRMHKYAALQLQTLMLAQLRRPSDVTAKHREILALFAALHSDSPEIVWVPQFTVRQTQMLFMHLAKTGALDNFDAEIAEFLERPPAPLADANRYDVACALSLASKHGTPAEREARAVKAVTILNGLLGGPFYMGPTNADHVDKDADLSPIRDREDFKAFRAKMPAAKK